MHTVKLSVLAAAVLAIGGAAVALSQPPDAPHGDWKFPISIADAEAKAAEAFSRIDADASGTISKAEFAAADMPMDHDGPRPRHHPRGRYADDDASGMHSEEHEAEYFQALDTDGNGQLSPAEFSREHRHEVHRSLMKSHAFEHMDTDHDGELSKSEFPGRLARLKELDADGNGEVTRDELRDGMRARHQQGS